MEILTKEAIDMEAAVSVGVGALSTVYRAPVKETKQMIAVKVYDKRQLLQLQKVDAVLNEKTLLQKLSKQRSCGPRVVKLYGTSQCDDLLYMFLELCEGGDLQEYIQTHFWKDKKGTEGRWLSGTFGATFHDGQCIIAQIVMVLELTFKEGIVLRDLKSENICFDRNGHVVFIDFDCVDDNPPSIEALSRESYNDILHNRDKKPQRRRTVSEINASRRYSIKNFCGTAQFVSPEMIGHFKWSQSSDLWALGIITYQLFFGVYPFNDTSPYLIMRRVLEGELVFPPYPEEGSTKVTKEEYEVIIQFIRALLQHDPSKRLGVLKREDGSDGWNIQMDEVRRQPFFNGVVWTSLENNAPSYDVQPKHSDEYAAKLEDSSEGGLYGDIVNAAYKEGEKKQQDEGADENEDDDVVDDVGITGTFQSAHSDFQ